MKNLLFIGITILLLAFNAFSQSALILPNSVGVPKVATMPACNANEKGKQVFNTNDNKMYFCNGTSWTDMTVGGFTLPYSGSGNIDFQAGNALFNIENTNTNSGRAIYGKSAVNGVGIFGESNSGVGVFGKSMTSVGVNGYSDTGVGVRAYSQSGLSFYSWSQYNFAGYFQGRVFVEGRLGLGNYENNTYDDIDATLQIKATNVSDDWGQHIRLINRDDSGYGDILHDTGGFKMRNFQAGDSFFFRNSVNTTVAKIDNLGNTTLHGELVVNDTKGIVQNYNGTQMKIYNRNISYSLTIGAESTYIADAISLDTFSSNPAVYIGDVDSQTGDYYKVMISPVAVTTNSVRLRFFNPTNSSITFTGTWSIIAIGPK